MNFFQSPFKTLTNHYLIWLLLRNFFWEKETEHNYICKPKSFWQHSARSEVDEKTLGLCEAKGMKELSHQHSHLSAFKVSWTSSSPWPFSAIDFSRFYFLLENFFLVSSLFFLSVILFLNMFLFFRFFISSLSVRGLCFYPHLSLSVCLPVCNFFQKPLRFLKFSALW